MCGIVGCFDLNQQRQIDREDLQAMAQTIIHRGPDADGFATHDSLGFGFRRLSIIDLTGGDQPMYNEDHSIVLVCNGEIFNYRELRDRLMQRGHTFRTHCDVEVILHLYEERGVDLFDELNGQFSFALYDIRQQRLLLARDHVGILPLYYTVSDQLLIFGSEIKALLKHPTVRREVNLTGLDQVFSFPGIISPVTMFKGIESLPAGHYLLAQNGNLVVSEYWDLNYPHADAQPDPKPESYYVEKLQDLLMQSVRYRLQADVPVGFYLSGGLDSSLIAALIHRLSPDVPRHSFSIEFAEKNISEAKYQQLMASHVNAIHHSILFDWKEIEQRMVQMIYHCECPVKESYNTCSLALAEAARTARIPVILTGEGSDELFAGYVGYRMDQSGRRMAHRFGLESMLEEELSERIWGDKDFFYEHALYDLQEIKTSLYAPAVVDAFASFDCFKQSPVNIQRLRQRHPINQRSYLDIKLRLSDHLLSDHGDRMAMAHSVEARYPFLDRHIIEFAREVPPHLKLNQLVEKYIVKEAAKSFVPQSILKREKYGFNAPGSPYLLQQNIEWVEDMLSYEHIRQQGYFNADVVERLKTQYRAPGFRLNIPFEHDLLMIVLTFSLFVDIFELPYL